VKNALLLLLVLVAGAGCVRVKPYQREYLSRRSLNFHGDRGEDRFKQHLFESREGARGGTGEAGGGCGCN
jgi:hypothetical protein